MPGQPDRALASMGVYIFNAKFLFEQLANAMR
jgi:glucose-1-phosphate adenylyltransferase